MAASQTELKKEIQKAVRDYVDQLLAERTGPGRGMAVSAGDLLAAARKAGRSAAKAETAELLSAVLKPTYACGSLKTFVQANDNVWDDTVSCRGGSVTSREAAVRSGPAATSRAHSVPPPTAAPASAKPAANKKRDINDYHWMMWKTGRTPTPAVTIPTSGPSANRAFLRPPPTPAGMRPRTYTPHVAMAPTPDLARGMTPATDMFRPESVALPPTPEPEMRVPSVGAGRVQTPASMKPDHRDVMDSGQVAPRSQLLNGLVPASQDQTSRFNAWVSTANEYEREVALNLMTAVNGVPAPPMAQRTHAKNATTMNLRRAQAQRARPRTAGVRTSQPANQSYYNPRQEAQLLRVMGQSMDRKSVANPYGLAMCADVKRPSPHPPPPAYCKDYTHEASHFMNVQRPYKSTFTVNPEWSSESCGRKLTLGITTRGRGGGV